MQIGILETGHPPERLGGRFPSYGAMVEALIGDGHRYECFDVTAGRWPAAPDVFEAYVVTGSPASVYEPIPWVVDLLAFLRDLDRKTKLVGLCFGHQALAQAFGGQVERSERGWGLGLHAYTVIERAPFMDDAQTIAIPVSHQDQVVDLPPARGCWRAAPSRPTACWPTPTGPPSRSSAIRSSARTTPAPSPTVIARASNPPASSRRRSPRSRDARTTTGWPAGSGDS
ncbi:type 1 glutamine amidotransferase [Methylorubrum suomiense]